MTPPRGPGDWLECPLCGATYVYSRRCRCGLYLVGRPRPGRILPPRPFAIRQDDGTWDIYPEEAERMAAVLEGMAPTGVEL